MTWVIAPYEPCPNCGTNLEEEIYNSEIGEGISKCPNCGNKYNWGKKSYSV